MYSVRRPNIRIERMIGQILADILYYAVHYGTGAMAVGMLSVLAVDKIKKRDALGKIYIGVMSSYIFMVISLTLLSREPGVYQTVDLTMFDVSPLLPALYIAHYLENFVMLMPLGFMLPIGIRVFRNPLFGMTAGVFASSCIEFAQYYTQLGTFALDDILANSIGSAIGFILFVMMKKLYKIVNSRTMIFDIFLRVNKEEYAAEGLWIKGEL